MSSRVIRSRPSAVRISLGIGGACRYTSRPKNPRMKNAADTASPNSSQRRPWRGMRGDEGFMIVAPIRLFDEGALEQHVVLEMDVDHQLLLELLQAEEERAPS